MIFSNFNPKKLVFWPFFKEKYSKTRKIDNFGCKKTSKFEENPQDQNLFLIAAN